MPKLALGIEEPAEEGGGGAHLVFGIKLEQAEHVLTAVDGGVVGHRRGA